LTAASKASRSIPAVCCEFVAVVGPFGTFINVYASLPCCKIFIPRITCASKISHSICTDSISVAKSGPIKLSVDKLTLIYICAIWLSNISLAVQSWTAIFIIPTSNLVISTQVISITTDFVTTSIIICISKCFCIVYENISWKISGIQAESSTLGPSRIPAIIVHEADSTTFLTRMLWGTGPFTTIILGIPQAFVYQEASGKVIPCQTVVLAADKHPRTVFVLIAVSVTYRAVGVFIAAVFSSSTVHR
jgi:hypothetical protein